MADVELVKALTVPFAAGFVVQRVVEILDTYTTSMIKTVDLKKFVVGIISLVLGWLLAGIGGIHIFEALKWTMDPRLDVFVSGIFISGGSEGFNSLMKFAQYKKEASKADAADKLKTTSPAAVQLVNPQPSALKVAA